jgi:hypothetical protein
MSGSDDELRALITTKFGIEPCSFQIEAIDAVRRGFHVFVIAPTGAGKTTPLAAPVVLEEEGLTLIITALNVITSQIVTKLGGRSAGVIELHGTTGNVILTKEDKQVCYTMSYYIASNVISSYFCLKSVDAWYCLLKY